MACVAFVIQLRSEPFCSIFLQNLSFPSAEKNFGQDGGAIPIFNNENILKMEEKKLFMLKFRVDLLFVVVNDEFKNDSLQTGWLKNLKLAIHLAQ